MKRKAHRQSPETLPQEAAVITAEAEPQEALPAAETESFLTRAVKRAAKRTKEAAEEAAANAELQPTRREVWAHRRTVLERTVKVGKFTGRSVKRVTGLIRRASSLVDRAVGLPDKIKALTGFDVMGLLSK